MYFTFECILWAVLHPQAALTVLIPHDGRWDEPFLGFQHTHHQVQDLTCMSSFKVSEQSSQLPKESENINLGNILAMDESLSAQAELHFPCLGWLTFRNSYPKPSLTFCISLHSWDGIGDPSGPVPTQTVLRFCEITRGTILLNTLGSSNRNQNFLTVEKAVYGSQCVN